MITNRHIDMFTQDFTVDGLWEAYAEAHVPKDATPEQINEYRKAFVGGMLCMICFQKFVGKRLMKGECDPITAMQAIDILTAATEAEGKSLGVVPSKTDPSQN